MYLTYCINRFVDRDMYMRYAGGGIGHYRVDTADTSPAQPTTIPGEDQSLDELSNDEALASNNINGSGTDEPQCQGVETAHIDAELEATDDSESDDSGPESEDELEKNDGQGESDDDLGVEDGEGGFEDPEDEEGCRALSSIFYLSK